MGIDALITVLIGMAGTAGGFMSGKRMGVTDSMSIATNTVDLLQIQVNALTSESASKDAIVTDLRARVELLEQLVTQRARVEEVYNAVKDVHTVVNHIKEQVDGTSGS